jgi:hypothetical protein
VITTVWVGVFVVCLFNLRFGWVLSGLVVPGYLVPLFIAKPISALVVLLEASVTYAAFWLLSERLASHRRWSSYFGRDRFMGLILVSVAVRLLLDGWLLPLAAAALDRRYGWTIDWQHNLHSFGLIVVALLANQLYKPGYLRGMAQSLVMIGITFLIVRYGLMEVTNFRIGAVVYLYEGFASSVLASPKAYIILIVTCFIASRMNLRYGWDFSGIMIPALLALEWYQPWKILTSFAEALIIYLIGSAVLNTKLFASVTVEGARKVLLFFNISFVYKLLLGHALAWAGVEQRISDYYGFGYLLPTLIAIKAYDKQILARVTRATAQISLMGAVAGSLAGFVLALLIPGHEAHVAAAVATGSKDRSADVVVATIGANRIDRAEGATPRVPVRGAASFRAALRMIDASGPSAGAGALLEDAGFEMQALGDGRTAILPRGRAGFSILYNPRSQRRLAIIVPEPAAAPMLGLAALGLVEQQQARWLVLGGTRLKNNAESGFSPASLTARSLRLPTLVVRAAGQSHLQLASSLGDLLDLRKFVEDPTLQLSFGSADQSVAQLFLSDASAQRLVGTLDSKSISRPAALDTNQLAFIRFDLIQPMLEQRGVAEETSGLRAAARAVGLDFSQGKDDRGRNIYGLRRWGHGRELFLIRPGARGSILQLTNEPSLRAAAERLSRSLDARALLIAADWNGLEGADNQLLSLIADAAASRGPTTTALQLRARPSYGTPAGAVLATDRLESSPRSSLALLRQVAIAEPQVHLLIRDPGGAGLEIGPSKQLRYLQQAYGTGIAVLWVGQSR